MSRSRTLLSSGLALLLSSFAYAEDPAPAPAPQAGREGFLIGFSTGFGATYPCDTCADFAGEFHVGAMASPRLAVLAELGLTGGDQRSHDGLMLATIGVQYWPADRFWLRAGLGIGDSLDENDLYDDDRGWGGSVSAGYEVARHGRFAFDLEGRAGFVGDRHSFSINLGFHWY